MALHVHWGICFLYRVHLQMFFNPFSYSGIHQGAYTTQMNPRLSLVFLSVHLAQTLRPPGLIWPKLVIGSKALRNQDCIQWEHCPNPLLPSPL